MLRWPRVFEGQGQELRVCIGDVPYRADLHTLFPEDAVLWDFPRLTQVKPSLMKWVARGMVWEASLAPHSSFAL